MIILSGGAVYVQTLFSCHSWNLISFRTSINFVSDHFSLKFNYKHYKEYHYIGVAQGTIILFMIYHILLIKGGASCTKQKYVVI